MVTAILFAALVQATPINTTCPVKGNKYKVRDMHRVTYEGQVIGFC